jgi:hypothetical protein
VKSAGAVEAAADETVPIKKIGIPREIVSTLFFVGISLREDENELHPHQDLEQCPMGIIQ